MLLSCVRGNRLGAATALRELWVQNNRIRDLTAAANALKGLPQLQKVVFKPNPCCAEEEDEKLCRMYLLSQLRSLEFLDGPIPNGERDDADAFLQTDAGKAALQSLLERMAEQPAGGKGKEKERPGSRPGSREGKGRRPGRGAAARDEDDDVPERTRGSWSKSATTSALSTRRGARGKEGPNRKREGEDTSSAKQRTGSKGKGKSGADEKKERRGGWGRGAAGGAAGMSFEQRKKAAQKPAPAPKVMERSGKRSAPPSRSVSRHERTSAEVAAGVEAAALEDGDEEDATLANAKRLLNGLQEAASRAATPIAAGAGAGAAADPELEKENTPIDAPVEAAAAAAAAEGEEEGEDPTLANAKRLLAGLQAAGLDDLPTAEGEPSATLVPTPPPTPPRSSGGSSAKLSPARSSCSGNGMSIMDAVAGLADDPVPGTFLDSKRLFSNKRSGEGGGGRKGRGGSRGGRGGGRGRGRNGPSPIPKEERMKRHSAPEKGTAPPEQQQTGAAAGRPGTTGGLSLPALPSAGGPQFVLRYEPKRRPGQQRPAASTRTLRLSRPRGSSDLDDTADASSASSAGSGPVGVVVRYDGSATAKYPNGNLAISIDADGFDYDGNPIYRLYAGFRKDGSVACSFDSAGNGFANFASGSTCFTHNTDSGGFSMAMDGGMEQAWSGHAGTRGGSTEVAGGDNVSGDGNGDVDSSSSRSSSSSVIVKQLDEHLLLRYSTDPEVPTELFFRCGSVKHKFVHGKNPTMETWDPDDEFLFAEKKKKKRHEKTFELPAGHVLPSAKADDEPYTNDDQLQDIVRREQATPYRTVP